MTNEEITIEVAKLNGQEIYYGEILKGFRQLCIALLKATRKWKE